MKKAKQYFCAALLFLISACDRMDTVEDVYPDSETAINAGAIERGWIPTFLPPSAKDIREKHNLDTNEVWMRFSLESGELTSIEKSCHPIHLEMVALPRKRGGDWWPGALIDGAQPQAGEYVYYRCDDGALVAVKTNEQEVYYWRLSQHS